MRCSPVLCLLLAAALPALAAGDPARADWSSTSSAQLILRVDPASASAQAAGASYAIQGNGLAGTPLLNEGVAPAPGLQLTPVAAGAAFSLNMAVQSADSLEPLPHGNGVLPPYSDINLTQPGSAGSLAGEVISPIRASATAGGPGTTATLTQSNTFSVFR
ncbi:MAG: hypothetical protein VKM92_03895 [Cyanobacteriota bacterium]|nr:hypothetical protein [Cyanobacteriota bacterium]